VPRRRHAGGTFPAVHDDLVRSALS
jgi:hypothetical protein